MEDENLKKIKSCLTDPLTGKIPGYLKHYAIIKLDLACVYSTEKYNNLNLKLKKLAKEYIQKS